jgi:tetratricopeptide (TPR) repeat protein
LSFRALTEGAKALLGVVYSNLGENQKALDHYNQALPLLRALGNHRGEAIALFNIGGIYSFFGERHKALDHFNQSLLLIQSLGDRRGEARTLYGIGTIYELLGQPQKALRYYDQALPILRIVGDVAWEAKTLTSRAFAPSVRARKLKERRALAARIILEALS